MIEKYKDRLRRILSDEKVVKKRRSTKRRSTKRRPTKRRSAKKRRSTKRRSTKRRSPKRRSRFGDNPPSNETLLELLLERIDKIKKGANAYEENDDEVEVPVTSTLARDSLSKRRILNAEKIVKDAETEVMEAEEALAKANEALAEAEEARAEADEAPPPLPPLPPILPVSKWGTPGDRGPAPPPTARFNKQVPVVGSSLSAARAAAGAKWVDEAVEKLVNEIKKIGYKDEEGRWAVKFITLFEHYENVSDSLVGIMIRAKKRGLIEYVGEMLLQGKDNDVVITVI